jgi:hypothetical protein
MGRLYLYLYLLYNIFYNITLTLVLILTIIGILLTQYCSGDKIEKNEMGGACSEYGGQKWHIQCFGRET